MKILKIEESREMCTEAGWYAYDFFLEREMSKEDIYGLKALGEGFVYLESLKNPFYKIEDRLFMVKGTEGKAELRFSAYKEYEETIKEKLELLLKCL